MGMIAFHLDMANTADLLCRVIGLVAQRDLDIAAIDSRPGAGNGLCVRIGVHALDDASARIVAAKMARCIGVDRVQIETGGTFVREEPLHRAVPILA